MKIFIKKNLISLGLLSLSILFFSLSFPGYFSKEGLAFFSFIALIPMFLVVFRQNYLESVIYGFIFGCCKFLLFNYWLKSFDLAAFAVVPVIYGIYFLLLFPLFNFLYQAFPKRGYIPITLAWLFYEIFRTTNIIGYSFGLMSHSMYKTHLFTGIVDIVGSFYLSIIIIFPGILISYLYSKGRLNFNKIVVPGTAYLLILILSIIYTQTSKVNYSNSPKMKISLIQHNSNAWLTNNTQAYSRSYEHLKSLSVEAEASNPDLIIWPETSFIPAIEWHKKYRPSNERDRYDLIMKLEDFLKESNTSYIIGNNESFNPLRDKHYNSAYLYKNGVAVSKYRKMNLVPFTEEFPFPDKLPWLFDYVQELGAKQYNSGKEQTLFETDGVKSTILICYEDAFSDLPRESVNNGSDLLINITNVAWTSSHAAALQHVAAASLRTIENRRSLVRAGTSGYTAVIDPNGKILKALPIFTKAQLTYDVPIYNEKLTIYTRYGHKIEIFGIILFIVSFIWGVLYKIYAFRKSS